MTQTKLHGKLKATQKADKAPRLLMASHGSAEPPAIMPPFDEQIRHAMSDFPASCGSRGAVLASDTAFDTAFYPAVSDWAGECS